MQHPRVLGTAAYPLLFLGCLSVAFVAMGFRLMLELHYIDERLIYTLADLILVGGIAFRVRVAGMIFLGMTAQDWASHSFLFAIIVWMIGAAGITYWILHAPDDEL
jgi:hypothetical protein